METILSEYALAVQHIQLDALVSRITQLIYVDRIYIIGYSCDSVVHDGMYKSNRCSQHYELLVITQLSCNIDALNVQRTINESKSIDASVTLQMHNRDNVIKAIRENNRFFNILLRSDKLIYQQEGLPWVIWPGDYDRSNEYSCAKLFWYHRQQRAKALLLAAAKLTEEGACLGKASLLNHAMEQICLGFIFVSIGYRPGQSSLNRLFGVCRCIDPAIDEILPTTIHPTDIGLLNRRCNSWMKKAEELIDVQLKRLAAFQHQS